MALDYTAFRLAQMADVAGPDSSDSPGAKFLLSVQDAVNEAREYDTECTDRSDTIHEIADNAPDVYTHERWMQFVDLCAYNEDISELGGDIGDLTGAAGIALYMIAERLATALFEEVDDDDDDDDEDEDDDISDIMERYEVDEDEAIRISKVLRI